ncbi:MAG: hypothetical protein COB24_12030 [Hyphomicrobiales bacterium]|nr:MAG: hypothetical protein COB24_12030 [Hyphomicrobiales bacterium]
MKNDRHPLKTPFDFGGQEIKDIGFNTLKVSDRLMIAGFIDELPETHNSVASLEFEVNCLSVITGMDTMAFDDMSDPDFAELREKAAPFMPTGWASMLHSSAA